MCDMKSLSFLWIKTIGRKLPYCEKIVIILDYDYDYTVFAFYVLDLFLNVSFLIKKIKYLLLKKILLVRRNVLLVKNLSYN